MRLLPLHSRSLLPARHHLCRRPAAATGLRRIATSTASPAPTEYEQLYNDCIEELSIQGWLNTNGELLEPSSNETDDFLSYFNDVVQPLRRTFAWGVPTSEALQAIAVHSPRGVVEIGAGTGYWAGLLAERHGLQVHAYDVAPTHHGSLNGFHALRGLGNALPFHPVERGGAARAQRHPECTLLLCWPPSEAGVGAADVGAAAQQLGPQGVTAGAMERMAVEALRHFEGAHVAYVGVCRAASAPASQAAAAATAAAAAAAASSQAGGAAGGAAAAEAGGEGLRWDTGGPDFEAALTRDFALVQTVALPQWPPVRDSLTIWRRRAPAAEADAAAAAASGGIADGAAGVPSAGGDAADAATPHADTSGWRDAALMERRQHARLALLASLRGGVDRRWLRRRAVRWLRGATGGCGEAEAAAEARMLARALQRQSPTLLWLGTSLR